MKQPAVTVVKTTAQTMTSRLDTIKLIQIDLEKRLIPRWTSTMMTTTMGSVANITYAKAILGVKPPLQI